jgi:hypothetical protein
MTSYLQVITLAISKNIALFAELPHAVMVIRSTIVAGSPQYFCTVVSESTHGIP